MLSTVNSRYNEVGYNEITAYNEMEFPPQSTKCINYYPDITKEFTGPKHFVIMRVDYKASYKSAFNLFENVI